MSIKLEVFTDWGATSPAWVGEFAALPRPGDCVSVERDGYFQYWLVREVWHRGVEGGSFSPCILVELDD